MILLAGDVERNPGPEEALGTPRTCNKCNKVVRNGSHLKCAMCNNVCHKIKCSGINRTSRTQWVCNNHGLTLEEQGAKECFICSGRIKVRDDHLKCTRCENTLHKQRGCSQMSSQEVKGLNRSTWKCPRCRGTSSKEIEKLQAEYKQTPKNETPQQEMPLQMNCGICNERVKTGANCLKCSACMNLIHKQEKCSDMKAAAIKKMNHTTWRCKECQPTEPEKSSQEELEEGIKDTPHAKSMTDAKACIRCKGTVQYQKHLSCALCDNVSHKGCSNKSRYSKKDWICHVHGNTTEKEEEVKPTCRTCGEPFKEGNKHLKCTKCDNRFHKWKQCSNMSKYAIARINITTWECQECKNPGIEKSRKDGEAEDSQVRATYEEVRDFGGCKQK